jgi:hypothetical protein
MRRRAGWSPEDSKEYETALIEAFESGTTTTERIDALEVILADAVQAHRPWARDIEREALRGGLNKLIVEYGKRRQPDVVLAYNGRVISKPRRQGVVVRLARFRLACRVWCGAGQSCALWPSTPSTATTASGFGS